MRIYTSIASFVNTIDACPEGEAAVSMSGVLFPFKYKIKKGSKSFVVFTPGAFEKKDSWIRFQRSSYFASIDASCISFFDPTLFLSSDNSFKIGWFQGGQGSYIDFLICCFDEIKKAWGGSHENILFYASSAGGLPAVNLAAKCKGSKVFCSNIQTNIFKWGHLHINNILNYCYNGFSRDYVEKNFDKTNIYSIDEEFDLFLVQNLCDHFHYQEHYLPYVEKMFSKINLKTITYSCPDSGHNPLSFDKEIATINSILNGGDPFISYIDLV